MIDQQVGGDVGELCGGHRDAGIRRAVVQPQLFGVGVVGEAAGKDDAGSVARQLVLFGRGSCLTRSPCACRARLALMHRPDGC